MSACSCGDGAGNDNYAHIAGRVYGVRPAHPRRANRRQRGGRPLLLHPDGSLGINIRRLRVPRGTLLTRRERSRVPRAQRCGMSGRAPATASTVTSRLDMGVKDKQL